MQAEKDCRNTVLKNLTLTTQRLLLKIHDIRRINDIMDALEVDFLIAL